MRTFLENGTIGDENIVTFSVIGYEKVITIYFHPRDPHFLKRFGSPNQWWKLEIFENGNINPFISPEMSFKELIW